MQNTCAQSWVWLGALADINKLRAKDAYVHLVAHLSPLSEHVAMMVDHTEFGLHQTRRLEAESFSAGLHGFVQSVLRPQEADQHLAPNEDMPDAAGWTQIASVSLTTEEIDQYDEFLKHALRPVQLKFTERRGDATMFISGSSSKALVCCYLDIFG